MILGFGNNVVSSLASDITASQTTFSVLPGDGPLFSALLTSDFSNKSTTLKTYAKITLTDSGETAFEICHLTAVSGDTLTVIRGQEGTAAKGWSLKDVVANFATRGSENAFPQITHIQSGFYTSGTAGGTANSLTLDLPATFFLNGSVDWVLKTPIVVYPSQNNTGAATMQLTMGGRVLGVFPLYKGNKAELSANDIIKDSPILCLLEKSKSYFSVLNPGEIYLGGLYLQKSKNGTDIPDKELFVRNIGAARAFSGSVSIGGNGNWTTTEFITWLESQGAFNNPYWMCRGSWSYSDNRTITDTGCGIIQLAGSVIEVMGVREAMTIRVTTPTTMSGAVNSQFTYINNGDAYSPGWRRDFNTANPPPDSYPVGAPIPWPSDTTPANHALMQGQNFDKAAYPMLAVAYPSGVIPDMRGQTIKGKPVSGRAVLSQEQDGIKSHDHSASSANTDLGTKGTTSFDYGTKTTNSFDYGTKTTNTTGAHTHTYTGPTSTTVKDGDYNQALASMGTLNTGSSGDHAHTVGIGAHTHTVGIGAHTHNVILGAHNHAITVNAAGNAENTVKNIAYNYLVRLA